MLVPAPTANKPAAGSTQTLSRSRIEALSDGVFAFAITLLALQLQVPGGLTHFALQQMLRTFGPRLLTYILSFSIVGVFWVAHHVMMNCLRYVDRTLLWLNILVLLFVAALPTSAAFLGSYPGQRSAAIVYGANLVLTSTSLNILWRYACKDRRLVDPKTDDAIIRIIFVRTGVSGALYISGILLSFVNTQLSLYLYACVPLGYIFVQGYLDRKVNIRGEQTDQPARSATKLYEPGKRSRLRRKSGSTLAGRPKAPQTDSSHQRP